MKKITFIFAITLLLLCGCQTETEEEQKLYFIKISKEEYGDIVYDSRTGVEYWRSSGLYNYGTLTPLYDAQGNLLIYEEE